MKSRNYSQLAIVLLHILKICTINFTETEMDDLKIRKKYVTVYII